MQDVQHPLDALDFKPTPEQTAAIQEQMRQRFMSLLFQKLHETSIVSPADLERIAAAQAKRDRKATKLAMAATNQLAR